MIIYEFFHFLAQLVIMFLVAFAGGWFARNLKQPSVLWQLLGGILLGPAVFGALAPSAWNWFFQKQTIPDIASGIVVYLGVLIFLFVAGMGIDITDVRRDRLLIISTGISGTVIPFASGIFLAKLFPGANVHGAFSLILGAGFAVSSLAVIAGILMDLNILRSRLGSVIMMAAAISNLCGWGAFAMIAGTGEYIRGQQVHPFWLTFCILIIFSLVIFIMARCSGNRRILKRVETSGNSLFDVLFMLAVMLVVVVSAELIGITGLFGAFIAGIALAPENRENAEVYRMLSWAAISIFAPIYFVSVGLNVNFFAEFQWLLVLVVVVAGIASKVAGAGLGAYAAGMPAFEAAAAGWGLSARGAVGIVFATESFRYGFISAQMHVALVMLALISSIASGPAIKRLIAPNQRIPGR
jgi:Kef-type K+ transport system membrane component KefB